MWFHEILINFSCYFLFMEPVVSVKNLSKTFSSTGQEIKALDNLNINISKGEVFGLLGPNGAGKTTLISILCGFLIPDTGEASIFGMHCTNKCEKIQKRMNFVSGFGGVSEFFTTEELLYFYCMLYNLDNQKQRVDKALKITGLEKYKKRMPADFSSGLGRRFLISKALLTDPEVLLLDEPTVGLDVESARNLRKHIKSMKKQGTTILLTTHNMREAEELCDRVALIKEGRIIACGTFKDLKAKFFPYDVLEICCTQLSKIESLVSKRKSVVKTKKKNGTIKIYFKDRSDINAVLKLLSNSSIDITSINTHEPELEDLYSRVMQND